jgi:hypothetical protein
MTTKPQTERRWLRAVIAASAEPLPNFPWMRGGRRRPATMAKPETTPDETIVRQVPLFARPGSIAAH